MANSPAASRPGLAIAVGGLVAGVADILGAFAIYWPAPPAGILRSIAAGVVGSAAARTGGIELAALGLLLHFVVASGAAAVFVAACRAAPALARRPLLAGPLYGLVVFLVMNYAVVPLSAIGRFPGPWSATTYQVIALHVAGVGPPIALAARRWASEAPPRPAQTRGPAALR
jgi:hypothetical protein